MTTNIIDLNFTVVIIMQHLFKKKK